jgi:hypothetical protein
MPPSHHYEMEMRRRGQGGPGGPGGPGGLPHLRNDRRPGGLVGRDEGRDPRDHRDPRDQRDPRD